jgi:hypothetical protein
LGELVKAQIVSPLSPQLIHWARIALAIRERAGMDCVFEPSLRLTMTEALRADGELAASEQALRAARDYLLRQADALSEAGLRSVYLRNTLDAERILELAQERQI